MGASVGSTGCRLVAILLVARRTGSSDRCRSWVFVLFRSQVPCTLKKKVPSMRRKGVFGAGHRCSRDCSPWFPCLHNTVQSPAAVLKSQRRWGWVGAFQSSGLFASLPPLPNSRSFEVVIIDAVVARVFGAGHRCSRDCSSIHSKHAKVDMCVSLCVFLCLFLSVF